MNNEQVIKYISDNSKNPHAAMIAEWLLTGWDVEYLTNNEEWARANSPSWNHDTKYRLVRKPAYRVFRLVGETRPRVQYRNADGSESSTLPTNTTAIYLTDWVEYDRWPTPLIERIAAIDIEAAEWIVDNWDELDNPQYSNSGGHYKLSGELKNMFSWAVSPQKGDYWYEIHKKLGE